MLARLRALIVRLLDVPPASDRNLWAEDVAAGPLPCREPLTGYRSISGDSVSYCAEGCCRAS